VLGLSVAPALADSNVGAALGIGGKLSAVEGADESSSASPGGDASRPPATFDAVSGPTLTAELVDGNVHITATGCLVDGQPGYLTAVIVTASSMPNWTLDDVVSVVWFEPVDAQGSLTVVASPAIPAGLDVAVVGFCSAAVGEEPAFEYAPVSLDNPGPAYPGLTLSGTLTNGTLTVTATGCAFPIGGTLTVLVMPQGAPLEGSVAPLGMQTVETTYPGNATLTFQVPPGQSVDVYASCEDTSPSGESETHLYPKITVHPKLGPTWPTTPGETIPVQTDVS